ncbi:MAG: T9SS type A sorting domain-containing protein [Lentimicrobium sp.]|nr:T9SS type A sorting domain-containing protein [Lentimicrobium sp.]
MKKFASFITFLFLYSCVFSQFPIPIIDLNPDSTFNDYTINNKTQNSWEGFSFNPFGNYRALNLLANIIYDVSNNDPQPGFSGVDWPQASIADAGINTIVPNWVKDSSLFDTEYNQENNINGTFTRRFYESSFGNLHIIGDYVIITLPQSYIIQNDPLPKGQFTWNTLIERTIDYLNENGGIQAYWGHNLTEDFDSDNDSIIDLVNIIVRNSFRNDSLDYGYFNENIGMSSSLIDSILFNTGNYNQIKRFTLQCVGKGRQFTENPLSVLFHEFAHKLFGGNDMHSAGGNGWNYNSGRTFLQRMGGYGLMGQSGTGMVSANGFDRWWLHWKSPIYNTTNSFIAASNQVSDITKENGTKTFILRDFVTTGDAIRIKLPYTDADAKDQYIWLENHKIGTNNKLDFLTNSNSLCRPEGKAGIYAFYQVGKDVLSGDNIRPVGQSDHLRLISAEGNFNYMKLSEVSNECFNYITENGHGKKLDPNPFMGDNDAMIHFYNNSLDVLKVQDDYVFKLDIKEQFINGQWVANDSMPFLMDEKDPFRGTKTFNLSSNPAPVNTITFYNTNDNEGNITSTATPASLVNNNTIYITGLSITMTKLANGDYSVNTDWGHNRLDNSVAWTGKIALKESLYIYDNDTLLLKQNKTPIQITRDTYTGQFAPYTAFECHDQSEMYLSNNSRTILSEKSKFYILAGSVMTVQNDAKLIVKNGSELIIEGCGNLVLRGNGQLVVEPGGILTIKDGANVFMDGIANLNLQTGFIVGQGGIAITMSNALSLLGVPPLKQINGTTTWTNGTYNFFDDLCIGTGATLNLNGTTLKFFRNARVRVSQGAKLNMTNNSKLTTTCNSELWRGINVWGNPCSTQTPTTNQGHLVMNNSSIEYARVGVLLDWPIIEREPGFSMGYGGGIIIAENSTFNNNYIGVSFSGYTLNNISTFSNCLFTANNQFPQLSTGVDCHVNMNGVTGVDFKKCTFNYTSQIFGTSINNIVGIRSINSNFLVDGLPLNGKFQRSVFENLKYGVYSTASLSSRNFTVRNSVFRSCKSGIFGSGINSSRITENRFLQPKYISQSNFTQFAIFLEYCNNYTIQEDTLVGIDSQFKSEAGILIRNSGPSENLLYNNKLENFYSGIIAEGENRGSGTGLCIKCNDFSGNQTDINIIPRDGIPISSQGIKHDQGSNQDTITAPAGNWFTFPSSSNIININNQFAQPIEYFYHRYPLNQSLQPNWQHVVLYNNTVFLTVGTSQYYYKNTACPSKLNINQSKEELIASSMSTTDEISETQSQLVTLTDDGDTPLLVNSITSSAPFEALLLHDELMNTSPYLSDTALIEAGKKEEVLNSALVRDIMVANPHSAKSPEVISALEQRAEQLPEELMDEIKAGAELISARQALELTKSGLEADLAASRSELLQVYQKESNFDSLRWALTTFPEPLSAYQQVWTWFDQGNSNNGIAALQNLNIETIPEHHQINQPGYVQLAGILNLLVTDTTYAFSEDTVTINALFALSNEDNAAGVSARNLLSAYRLIDFEPSVTLPDTGLKATPVINKPKTKGKLSQEALHVFPNPASEYIVIAYKLKKEGELSIVSQDGRIVYSQSISHGKNQVIIRVNHLASGIYIVRIAEGKIVHSAKFTVK